MGTWDSEKEEEDPKLSKQERMVAGAVDRVVELRGAKEI